MRRPEASIESIAVAAYCVPTEQPEMDGTYEWDATTLVVVDACAARRAIHLEYFHDHVLIERRLFEGAPAPLGGRIAPDRARAGLGLEFKRQDAAGFRL